MLVRLLEGIYGTSVQRAIRWREKQILKGGIDPWEGCSENLKQYRKALDKIAEEMSNIDEEIIQSRFNPETGNIDLCRFISCEVVAEVEIASEQGACFALITLAPEVPLLIRECVEQHLRMKVEFVQYAL